MTPLSEGNRSRVAASILLRQERQGETPREALAKLHQTFASVISAPADAAQQVGRRVQDNTISGALGRLNAGKDEGLTSVASVYNASQAVKPGHMLAMHDMMTRAYVWDQVVRQGSQDLLRANPWAGKLGLYANGRFDDKLLANIIDTHEQGLPLNLRGAKIDDVKNLQTQLSQVKSHAADIGNEVALNYFDVPRAVQFLTKTGVVPFIKFQYKATGRIMEWADEKPWQFAPYYTAQRNANQAFSDKPGDWQQQMASMPQNVRDALVIPTGTQDRLGRTEYQDLSRWVPFGMFARPAGGGMQADGSAVPNQLLTMPLLEMMYGMYSGKDTQGNDVQAPGQSKMAALASMLALNFSPSGIGPGGRRASQIAAAMEQSRFVYNEDGTPTFSNPAMKAAQWYGNLPASMAAGVDHAFGGTGTATGAGKAPTDARPWTTPDQAVLRGFIPGATFSADPSKAGQQVAGAFDSRILGLTTKYNATLQNAQISQDPGSYREDLQRQADDITHMQQQKGKALLRFSVGQ